MKVRFLPEKFDLHIVAAAVIVDRVQRLVQVTHEMHQIIKGLVAPFRGEAGHLQFAPEALDRSYHAVAVRTVPVSIERGCTQGNVDVVPRPGFRVLAPHVIRNIGYVGEVAVRAENLPNPLSRTNSQVLLGDLRHNPVAVAPPWVRSPPADEEHRKKL